MCCAISGKILKNLGLNLEGKTVSQKHPSRNGLCTKNTSILQEEIMYSKPHI